MAGAVVLGGIAAQIRGAANYADAQLQRIENVNGRYQRVIGGAVVVHEVLNKRFKPATEETPVSSSHGTPRVTPAKPVKQPRFSVPGFTRYHSRWSGSFARGRGIRAGKYRRRRYVR